MKTEYLVSKHNNFVNFSCQTYDLYYWKTKNKVPSVILLPTLSWDPTLFVFSTDQKNPIGKFLKSFREKQSEPETFPLKIYLSIEQVFAQWSQIICK